MPASPPANGRCDPRIQLGIGLALAPASGASAPLMIGFSASSTNGMPLSSGNLRIHDIGATVSALGTKLKTLSKEKPDRRAGKRRKRPQGAHRRWSLFQRRPQQNGRQDDPARRNAHVEDFQERRFHRHTSPAESIISRISAISSAERFSPCKRGDKRRQRPVEHLFYKFFALHPVKLAFGNQR